MLRWLLEQGADIERRDEFGDTPLMDAAREGNVEMVAALLQAGASVHASKKYEQTALDSAEGSTVARILLQAGADPQNLTYEARRALVGLPPEPDEEMLTVTKEEYQADWTRRFGRANPEKVDAPFWKGMIRAGIDGFQAARKYEGEDYDCLRGPVWCARRFGQSITFLPDGRIIQVAGEHEDYYDPDFCIYNDVFVHEPDGQIGIYAYPQEVFPPTDFHTATLVGESIYLVGSLGYHGRRQPGRTPVYRLDTRTLRVEAVETNGEAPGWIFEHAAGLVDGDAIRVTGGKVVTMIEGEEQHVENAHAFMLRVADGTWSVEKAAAP